MIHPRIRELASAAAKTGSWITDNDKAIPALTGAWVQVDSITTVSVSLRDAPYGWLELADDEQSFIVYAVDLDAPEERHLVAEYQETMPMGLIALTTWHADRARAAAKAAAEAAQAAAEAETAAAPPPPEPELPEPDVPEPIIDPPEAAPE